MNEIKKRRTKPKEQKSVLHNIEMLYKARNSVAKFFDGYSTIASEAKHTSFNMKDLNINY